MMRGGVSDFIIGICFTQYLWYMQTEIKDDHLQKTFQTTALPERIAKLDAHAAVALSPVCTVHFNLEVTIVSSTCCKSTNGKNLKQTKRKRSGS